MDVETRRKILEAVWKFLSQARSVGNVKEAMDVALPMLIRNVYYFRISDLYARQAVDLRGVKISQVRVALEDVGLFWRYKKVLGTRYRMACLFADGAAEILRAGGA